jgi:Cu/Ag efflux protein CusF
MKKMILLVALLTLVAFVSGVMAQPKPAPAPPEKPKLEKFSGDIKNVDAVAKSIVVAKGKVEKTFVVDDKTKITKGKDTLAFADLKKGMNVSLEYNKVGDKLIAVAIKVAAPKAPPKEAPKKEAPKK